MKKQILFSLLFLFHFFSNSLFATHIVGGEMRYEYVSSSNGSNKYKVELIVYRDCYNGVPGFDSPAAIGVFTASDNQILTWELVDFEMEDTLPFNPLSLCHIGPVGICFEKTRYVTEITLPYNSDGYYLVYQRCCRNNIITNLINPLDQGATYSVFISGESQLLHNSSPKWTTYPPVIICNHMPLSHDHSAIDTEGDSIVYSFCAPLNGATPDYPMPQPPDPPPFDQLNYNIGFSGAVPVPGMPPLEIDATTGLITGTPNLVGHYVVGVCGKEYRNGILLSEFSRDFEYVVSDCDQSSVYIQLDPIMHPECDTTYDFLTVDPQGGVHPYEFLWSTGDSTAQIQNIIPGSVYTVSVTDANKCQTIAVIRGNDCVWPGDADYDGLANNMDVLAIGLFNGDYGPIRPNANSNWTPQPAGFWSRYQNNGVNLKHVDCDGSGFINNFDLDPITLNYQQQHPVAFLPVQVDGTPDLYFNFPSSTIPPFQAKYGTINLGTLDIPAKNAYGIAFTIKNNRPETKIDFTATFDESLWGVAPHTVTLQHQNADYSGIDIAICSTTKLPVYEFFGKVCGITMYTEEWKYPGALDLSFENIRLIDHRGIQIPVNPKSLQLVVGTRQADQPADKITMIPNPANGFTNLTFSTPVHRNAVIQIIDSKGVVVKNVTIETPTEDWKLNTAGLPDGNYFIRVADDEKIFTGILTVSGH